MSLGRSEFARLTSRANKFTRSARALEPALMLRNAAVVKVVDRKGVFFMFHHDTEHNVVNAIADALRQDGFQRTSDAGVVELFTTVDVPGENGALPSRVKRRFYGVALDPDDEKVSAILNDRYESDLQVNLQNQSEGKTPVLERVIKKGGRTGYTHTRIGGDGLPPMEAAEAARALAEHFATHGYTPRVRVDKGAIHKC